MKSFGLTLLLLLGIVTQAASQPVGLIVGQTPIIGGTPGQCLSIGDNRSVGAVACGTGGAGVDSFSAGTTGFTPSTGATGNVVLNGVLVGANGGTGVANSGKTITLGGNLTTSGAFPLTFSVTGSTNLSLPTSGTVATVGGTVATFSAGSTGFLPSSATPGNVVLSGTLLGASGGTGVANTGKTITLGGNLTTSGAFATTFTMTADTNVTFPTSGTLATVGGSVGSWSGGTTGLTPASPTAGAVVMAGILNGASGGTGVSNTGKTITLGGNLITSGDITIPTTIATLGANTFSGNQTVSAAIIANTLSVGTAANPARNVDLHGPATGTMNLIVTGTANTGSQYPFDYLLTFSGDPAGSSDVRGIRELITVTGTENFQQLHGQYVGFHNQQDKKAGVNPSVFVNYTFHAYSLLEKDGDVSNAYVYFGHFGMGSHDFDSSGNVGVARVYQAGDTAWITDHTATGTISSIIGFNAGQLGHPTRVTNLNAFRAEDDTAASTAVAFLSQYTPGTGKLAFKDEGGAGTQLVGAVGIGDTVLPVNTNLSVRRVGITLGTSDGTGSTFIANATITPNADGLSDYRSIRQSITINGANAFANVTGVNNVVTDAHTAGTGAAVTGFGTTVTFSGPGTTTLVKGVDAQIRLAGDGVMTTADGIYAHILKTAGTTGTIVTSRGVHVDDGGGAFVTGAAIGVDVEDFTNITGGGIVAAFRSNLNAAAANRWALYMAGTAPSAMAASLRVGGITAPVATLDVTGSISATTTVKAQSYIGIKFSGSLTAPGAGLGQLFWVPGTNAGTARLVGIAGTSNTPFTIIDNVGSGF